MTTNAVYTDEMLDIFDSMLKSLDTQDLRLIGLLRENARMSVAQLAKQLQVSRGTVQNRIDRLIADNVLLGFTVRTTPAAICDVSRPWSPEIVLSISSSASVPR